MNIFLIIKWSHVDVMRPGLSLSLRAWLSWHHDVSLSGIAHLLISRSRKIKKNLRWYRIGIGRYSEFSGSDLIWKKWYRCIPKQDLAPILISPPHTYVHNPGNDDRRNKWRWHKHIQTKANMDKLCEKAKSMLLTYQEETTQPRRPIRALPAPWDSLTTEKLLRYLRGSYLLPDRKPSFKCFVPPIFSFFLSLSIVDLLISVCALKLSALFSLSLKDTPPVLLIGYMCVLGPTLRSNAFFKNCLMHL